MKYVWFWKQDYGILGKEMFLYVVKNMKNKLYCFVMIIKFCVVLNV